MIMNRNASHVNRPCVIYCNSLHFILMDKEKTEQITIRIPVSALREVAARAHLEHISRATKLVQLIFVGLEKGSDANPSA